MNPISNNRLKMILRGINKYKMLLVVCFALNVGGLYAQSGSEVIKFSGSASVFDNFYSSSGIDPRQPANLFTTVLRANVTLFDQIELPFELYYSSRQTEFQQPFNQFGVSPKITSWLILHGGYFSTQFSELTFGDLRILGGGLELTPGDFRFKAVYGRSRQSVEPNKVSFMPGVYQQNIYAVSMGYGNQAKTFLNVNLFHAKDDSTTVNYDTLRVAPNENLVGSLDFGIAFSEAVSVRGEVGVSAFSGDLGAEKIDDISVSSYLLTPNISTKIDAAAKLQINVKPSRYWSVGLASRWIGPGFKSLGYALMPNDLMEFTISPSLRLLNNKLNIRSRAGVRYNNLQNQRMSTTSRFTGFIAANWQVNKTFGLDVNYNNNQIESGHKNDTLRLSNVFNSVSVSPRFFFNGFGGTNNLILTYSYQDVSDKNAYTSQITGSKSNSAYIVHSLSYVSTLSFATTCLYNNTKLADYASEIYHVSETVSRRFFKNSLSTSLSLGANFVHVTSNTTQLVFRVNATYSLKKLGNLSFYITNNNYNGTGAVTQNYNEIYGSLQYNINF